jgi:DNA-binding NarL/FixJ family response regulator
MVSPAPTLRTLVVADDPLARTGLSTLLAAQPGCAVMGQVPPDAELGTALQVFLPDVVVWDLGWEPAAALERLPELAQDGPPMVVLLPDENHAADAWSAGARGLFLREVPVESLVAGLTAVAQGLVVIDPALAQAVRPARDAAPAPLAEELTPREREVLQLLAEGLSNKAVAYQLDISEHTVKFHVNALMGKLGAQSRTEAVVRATRLGLIIL